jgi:hypothetical protein
MRTLIFVLLGLVILGVIGQFFEDPKATLETTYKKNYKMSIFNSPNDFRHELNNVLPLSLRSWKQDAIGDFCSTPYYDLDNPSDYKLPNNIAFYLSSHAPNTVENFKIILNVNFPRNKKRSLQKLHEYTQKCLAAIGITPEKQLLESILKGKSYYKSTDLYSIDFSLDQSNIESFVVWVKPK